MAVSPPYSIDATAPVATALVSAYPTTEHTFRDTVSSWLNQIANPTDGKIRADQFSDSPEFTGTATLNGNAIDAFPSGTRTVFHQSSAPTGWTKDTTLNNNALRVVSGTAGSGGSADFDAVFTNRIPTGTVGYAAVTGTVGYHALTTSEIPYHYHGVSSITVSTGGSHSHTIGGNFIGSGTSSNGGYLGGATPVATSTDGVHTHSLSGTTDGVGSNGGHNHTFAGGSHTHTFTGSAMNFAVKYTDIIIAAKD